MTDKPSERALRVAEELIGGDGDRYFISQEEIEAVAAALDAYRRRGIEEAAQECDGIDTWYAEALARRIRALADKEPR